MIYADYEFYSGIFNGRLGEKEFNSASLLASALLDSFTHGRAEREVNDHGDRLKIACCAVADKIASGKSVKSASNDGYSETYDVSGHGLQREAYDAALMYLGDTGLMFAGVE